MQRSLSELCKHLSAQGNGAGGAVPTDGDVGGICGLPQIHIPDAVHLKCGDLRFRVLCSGGGEGGDNHPGSDHGNTGLRGNLGFFRLVGSFVCGGQRGVRRSFLCFFTGQLYVQRGIQRLQRV